MMKRIPRSSFALITSALAIAAFIPSDALAAAVSQDSFAVRSGVWPVMVRMNYNPILQIKVDVEKSPKAVRFQSIELDFSQTTNIEDIEGVDIFVGGNASAPGVRYGWATPTKEKPVFVIEGKHSLEQEKINEIWVSVRMKNNAEISGKIGAKAPRIFIDGEAYETDAVSANQRIGYAVAKVGDLGSKNYRIPAMVRNPKTGTLIATFDIRYEHSRDLPANIDVGVSRSEDGGRTWTPVESVMTSKNMEVKDGVGDPGILVNDRTGEIWIAGLWAPKSGHPIWSSVSGSTDPKNCGQMLLIKSDDDGKTWGEPINITADIKRLGDPDTKNWGLLFQGPGAGICTSDGVLVFPSQVWLRNPENTKTQGEGASQGVLVYSKDGGKTWTSTKSSPFGGSESTCVEMKDGSIALNTRTNKGWGRTGSILKKIDLDCDWVIDENLTKGSKGALRQPGGCQGALLSLGDDWYFSNPNSGKRDNMTLKHSSNEGKTWNKGLLYDERGCAGYSTTAFIDEKGERIGVLYEGVPNSQSLFFLSIPTEEIRNAK